LIRGVRCWLGVKIKEKSCLKLGKMQGKKNGTGMKTREGFKREFCGEWAAADRKGGKKP